MFKELIEAVEREDVILVEKLITKFKQRRTTKKEKERKSIS